jgi:large subunit ribosomal protein L22
MIRGVQVHQALAQLQATPRRASTMFRRLLQSAVANVEDQLANDSTLELDTDELHIKEVRVDEGPTLKRWRPRSMGRVNQILKRTCHLHVVLAAVRPDADDDLAIDEEDI